MRRTRSARLRRRTASACWRSSSSLAFARADLPIFLFTQMFLRSLSADSTMRSSEPVSFSNSVRITATTSATRLLTKR